MKPLGWAVKLFKKLKHVQLPTIQHLLRLSVSLCNVFVSICTEDQNRQTGTEALLHTVVLRLGAILVLMLTVGDWSDVVHVLITFLGEAVCMLLSQDLLQAVLQVCANLAFVIQASTSSMWPFMYSFCILFFFYVWVTSTVKMTFCIFRKKKMIWA